MEVGACEVKGDESGANSWGKFKDMFAKTNGDVCYIPLYIKQGREVSLKGFH